MNLLALCGTNAAYLDSLQYFIKDTHSCFGRMLLKTVKQAGWLNTEFHAHFREVLLHAGARYQLGCPTYVLMPDHIHLIWIGAHAESDQLLANRFLRKHLSLPLQKQAYDHVLREEERTHDRFTDTCHYIRDNPVRAGLVEKSSDWHYQGAMVSGYPSIDETTQAGFWKCFHAYQESLER